MLTAEEIGTLASAIAERLLPRLAAEQERLLDDVELGERLGIGARTVRRYVAAGKLPRPLLDTNGVTRWEWDRVKAWLGERPPKRKYRRRGPKPAGAETGSAP
jgi:predicted DNA-binding transcriptional regulator AlpA